MIAPRVMFDSSSRKDRMVSLRVTERDYARLLKLCDREGVRSLSALARIALHRFANRPDTGVDGGAQERLLAAERRLDSLEVQVRRLRPRTRGGSKRRVSAGRGRRQS
jgi:hypothetical protein